MLQDIVRNGISSLSVPIRSRLEFEIASFDPRSHYDMGPKFLHGDRVELVCPYFLGLSPTCFAGSLGLCSVRSIARREKFARNMHIWIRSANFSARIARTSGNV